MDSIKNSIRRFFYEHGSSILMFFANVLAFIIQTTKTIVMETYKEIKGGG